MMFDFTKLDFYYQGTRYILWNSARQNIIVSLHITIFISAQAEITIVISTQDEIRGVSV